MEKITEKEKDRPESFADIVKEQLEMQMEQYTLFQLSVMSTEQFCEYFTEIPLTVTYWQFL